MPERISTWGQVSFALATVALLSASLFDETRLVTLVLSGVGLLVALVGFPAIGEKRAAKDNAWLALGGTMSGLVLCLAFFVPEFLNHYWALGIAVPKVDPAQQVAVLHKQPREEGRPLAAEDWAEAATEGIRLDGLLLFVESVKAGPLPGKGKTYLLVHIQFANVGHETITFDGFPDNKHPVLTDNLERAFEFLERRQRLPARGDPVFGLPGTEKVEVLPTNNQGCLLVFDVKPGVLKDLKPAMPARLEVPASAWGRRGVCKFRISEIL